MANRSYLYSTNITPSRDAVAQGRKLIGISEYAYDIPIVFKLLLSGQSRTCPSSIWDSDDNLALIGDYEAGVANLEKFLARIKQPEAQSAIAAALEFLKTPDNCQPFFVLECCEIFEMDDAPLAQQNLQLLEQIQNLQGEMDAAIQTLSQPSPVPPPVNNKPAGFLAKLFGLAPPVPSAAPAPDPLAPIHALGLGHWSNYLYFDFSSEHSENP